MMKLNKKYTLEQIILYMKDEGLRNDNFCLYGETDTDLILEKSYYVADYPDINDEDEEVYPDVVVNNNLEFLYAGQQFADVIDVALNKKPTATLDDFVRCLNHYTKHDNFLDI